MKIHYTLRLTRAFQSELSNKNKLTTDRQVCSQFVKQFRDVTTREITFFQNPSMAAHDH